MVNHSRGINRPELLSNADVRCNAISDVNKVTQKS